MAHVRRFAPDALAALFAMVTVADPPADPWLIAAAWLRLPVQVPLTWMALQARGRRSA